MKVLGPGLARVAGFALLQLPPFIVGKLFAVLVEGRHTAKKSFQFVGVGRAQAFYLNRPQARKNGQIKIKPFGLFKNQTYVVNFLQIFRPLKKGQFKPDFYFKKLEQT
jgi:hypothetical protein